MSFIAEFWGAYSEISPPIMQMEDERIQHQGHCICLLSLLSQSATDLRGDTMEVCLWHFRGLEGAKSSWQDGFLPRPLPLAIVLLRTHGPCALYVCVSPVSPPPQKGHQSPGIRALDFCLHLTSIITLKTLCPNSGTL